MVVGAGCSTWVESPTGTWTCAEVMACAEPSAYVPTVEALTGSFGAGFGAALPVFMLVVSVVLILRAVRGR